MNPGMWCRHQNILLVDKIFKKLFRVALHSTVILHYIIMRKYIVTCIMLGLKLRDTVLIFRSNALWVM